MKSCLFLLLLSLSVFAQKGEVAKSLDLWHKAAADSNLSDYFSLTTKDFVFVGTDATENWNRATFKSFCKPVFDKKKGWKFTSVQRNIYFSADKKTAWFDELLDTWMGICRGSGVMKLEDGKWKIAHYVLSMSIPNDDTQKVVEIKSAFDTAYLKKLSEKKGFYSD